MNWPSKCSLSCVYGSVTSNHSDLTVFPGGQRLVPNDQLGEGAEGVVFAIGGDLVAKLHHETLLQDGRSTRLLLKIKMLRQLSMRATAGTALCNVQWPLAYVFDKLGTYRGYVMRRVHGTAFRSVIRDWSWTIVDRMALASDMVKTVRALHELGMVMGDMSSNNLLVVRHQGRPSAKWIDVDSAALPGFPCVVATPRYVQPAVARGELPFAPSRDSDNYALSYLVFELLLGGVSPYAYKGGGSSLENTGKEIFAYVNDPALVPDGPWRARWKALPAEVRAMFHSAFAKAQPMRPNAAQWQSVLDAVAHLVLHTSPFSQVAGRRTSWVRSVLDFLLRRNSACNRPITV